MSFSSVDNKAQYSTDGIVDTFSFPYPFQQTSDLVVKLKDTTTLVETTLVENTDYTVTPVGDVGRYTSGSIQTTSTYASGSVITLLRTVANDQQTANYNPGGDFDEQSTEGAFDKSVMQAQQIYNLAVILKKTGNVAGPLELPDLADFAGKLLQINSAGTGITAVDSASSSDARVNSLFNGAAADDIFTTFINLVNGGLIIDGTGSPEGVKVAPVGSIFLRTDGAADTSIYFKETGAGNTGWVARDTFSSLVAATIIANTSLTTDTISEKTAAAGVTVDSCLIKDGAAAKANTVTDQGGGNALKCKVIDIGDWDMSSDSSVSVAHGVTAGNIRFIAGVIRNDAGDAYFTIGHSYKGSGASSGDTPLVFGSDFTGASPPYTSTTIFISRFTTGFFDSADFNATSYNRGWITIWYTE
jgi:hypothetical protein